MRRVVITGIGAVTPIGNSYEEFTHALRAGKCGISEVTRFDASGMKTRIAGEVKNFNPTEMGINSADARKMDRFTQLAVAASDEAVRRSGLCMDEENPWRVGVVSGSGIGGIETFEEQFSRLKEKGPGRVSPFFIPMMITNIAPCHIAIRNNAKGVNESISTACASSVHSIGIAFRLIQHGDADVIISGGAEAAITPSAFAGFINMKAMSRNNNDPAHASRPFDKNRDGFVLAEGAVYMVLEEYEHAVKRNAPIICEICGFGATDDAFHITTPLENGAGSAEAMRMAIRDAGIKPENIQYINAHGTSTAYNDRLETEAIKAVFGDHAYKLKVSSTKSMTGHMLGAAGAAGAAVCAFAISDSFIAPTINYEFPDEECDLDYVPNIGVEQEVSYAMVNSLGFGGHNGALILGNAKI